MLGTSKITRRWWNFRALGMGKTRRAARLTVTTRIVITGGYRTTPTTAEGSGMGRKRTPEPTKNLGHLTPTDERLLKELRRLRSLPENTDWEPEDEKDGDYWE